MKCCPSKYRWLPSDHEQGVGPPIGWLSGLYNRKVFSYRYTLRRMTWGQILASLRSEGESAMVNFPVRVAPLLLRSTPLQLLERRQKCFTRVEYKKLNPQTWLVEAMKEIPATTSRNSRQVHSRFVAQEHDGGLLPLISRADADTYNHGPRLLERAAYPLALRPFLPVRNALEITSQFFAELQVDLRVMQFRASDKIRRRTTMSHGAMTMVELDESLRINASKLEGIRIRAFDPILEEVCRIRLDNQCRILIERWFLPKSPIELVRVLARESTKRLRDSHMLSYESGSEEKRVVFLRCDAVNQDFLAIHLRNSLSRMRGVLVFPIDTGRSETFKVIDFISGVDCLIESYSEHVLALTFGSGVSEAFLDRMKSIVAQELEAVEKV